jgi:hypothetical protein
MERKQDFALLAKSSHWQYAIGCRPTRLLERFCGLRRSSVQDALVESLKVLRLHVGT